MKAAEATHAESALPVGACGRCKAAMGIQPWLQENAHAKKPACVCVYGRVCVCVCVCVCSCHARKLLLVVLLFSAFILH